jgi:hypothetical protein
LMDGDYPVTNGYHPNRVHAGVDFGGAGDGVTNVKAPISGTIIANTSACGKVAIFDGTNTIILAHMTARTTLGINKTINRGDYVGKVSKVVGGGCSVTGAHLHIEIRKGNNATMALPANDNRTTTFNPLTYFNYTSPTKWEFNTNNNFEGWTIYNISGATINNGILFMDPWGDDPYLFSPSISVDAWAYSGVNVRMASNGLDSSGYIYFKTQAENYYSEGKKVYFAVANCPSCGNAAFVDYWIPMNIHSKWQGKITGVRIDPTGRGAGGTNTDSIGIDYIRLY